MSRIVHHARSRGQLFLVDPGARSAITRMWVGAVDRLGREMERRFANKASHPSTTPRRHEFPPRAPLHLHGKKLDDGLNLCDYGIRGGANYGLSLIIDDPHYDPDQPDQNRDHYDSDDAADYDDDDDDRDAHMSECCPECDGGDLYGTDDDDGGDDGDDCELGR